MGCKSNFEPKKILSSALVSLSLVACDVPQSENDAHGVGQTTSTLAKIAEELDVRYAVLDNGLSSECPTEFNGGVCFRARLDLQSTFDIPASDVQIFFSHVEPIRKAVSDHFTISHVNGDLHRIDFKPSFKGFDAETIYSGTIWGGNSHLSEYYAMPNYYVADASGQAHVIQSTVPITDPTTGLEQLPHVRPLTDPARQFKRNPADQTAPADANWLFERYRLTKSFDASAVRASVIPKPQSVELSSSQAAELDLSRGITVHLGGVQQPSIAAALARLASLGIEQTKNGIPVSVKLVPEHALQHTNASVTSGAYKLSITGEAIDIEAAEGEGIQNALMSLAGLIEPGQMTVPQLVINDSPRFAYRGLHLDLARNFNSKEFVLNVLDQMAAYKLNKLTLQLSDDEGWRIEIPGLPELTDIGSKRCHDLNEDTCILPQLGSGPTGTGAANGYLSGADYREIVNAAADRHIEIIPFFDMPGHARAAIKSMEARYRRLKAEGNQAAAEEYLLSDPEDTSVYKSIQYYTDNTINACMPSSYRFVEKLADEMIAYHKEAGVPLKSLNIGADETPGAWKGSPACAEFMASNRELHSIEELGGFFIERVSHLLNDRGLISAGWGDGFSETDPKRMPANVSVFDWSLLFGGAPENTHALANRGWDLILATPEATYLDAPYSADPKERGYDWMTRQTDSQKVFNFMPENLGAHAEIWRNSFGQSAPIIDPTPLAEGIGFRGMQAQMWSETIRTDAQAAYMLFPRLIAFAERAWHKPNWEVPYSAGQTYSPTTQFLSEEKQALGQADWARFAHILGSRELAKLDLAEVPYRIPPVGARIKGDKLYAAVPFPGLAIEYKTGSGPWQEYTAGVAVEGAVQVRARSADGRRAGRALSLTGNQSTQLKRITLSYDDAPMSDGLLYSGTERTKRLIEALDDVKAGPATFFVTTRGIEAYSAGRERLEAYADAGHILASHTHTHPAAHKTPVEEYLADIDTAAKHLSNLPNTRPWFRFPYLDEGRQQEKIDKLALGLKARGLSNGYVTVDTYDWYLNGQFQRALREGRTVNYEALRDLYVRLSLEAAEHYDKIARDVLGSSPVHVLLLHENDLAARYAGDLVTAFRDAGWEIVHPDEAYKDPLPTPNTPYTGGGRLAALAIDAGWSPAKTTHWSIQEKAIDAAILSSGAFQD